MLTGQNAKSAEATINYVMVRICIINTSSSSSSSSVDVALVSAIFKMTLSEKESSSKNTFTHVYIISHHLSLGTSGSWDAEIEMLLLARCESEFSLNGQWVNYLKPLPYPQPGHGLLSLRWSHRCTHVHGRWGLYVHTRGVRSILYTTESILTKPLSHTWKIKYGAHSVLNAAYCKFPVCILCTCCVESAGTLHSPASLSY